MNKVCQNEKCQKPFESKRADKKFCCFECKQTTQSRNWYRNNKARWGIIRKRYLDSHVQQTKQTRAAYRKKHQASEKIRRAKYYRENRFKFLNQKSVRRSREKTSDLNVSAVLKLIKLERKKATHKCYYCRSRFKEVPHFDHVVPLAKGGKHEPSNIAVSCPLCNRKKSARHVSELDWISEPVLNL